MNAKTLLQIHESDNVAVTMEAIPAGETVQVAGEQVLVLQDVPRGHKVALTDIEVGMPIVKYGFQIGRSSQAIARGAWVHSNNLETSLNGKIDYDYQPVPQAVVTIPQDIPQTFQGYVRSNGDVGIRNELWIINTVGCINKTAENLARMAHEELRGRGVDGVYHFAHPYGCSQLGDDLSYTQKALAGLARHPNAVGVLVIGLGCENNRLDAFQSFLKDVPKEKLRFMAVQEVSDEFEVGLQLLRELAEYARSFVREEVSVSKLKIGLKCGGSDGLSGITANPLVGTVSDLVVAQGGTSLLTEVPEMFGAETILMNRAKDEVVFQQVVSLVDNFKDYYLRHGQVIYENPSPGNKDGGITTLEEKSLGCTQKGGLAPVSHVLQYGESSQQAGLNLVQSPGNDMVSVTALTAAGAHLILFTTGRGTPMGAAVPTMKIASNTALAYRKPNWIDYNAGRLIEGEGLEKLGMGLYNKMIDVASGKLQTRSEKNGFREIAIFKDGVTL